VARPARGAGAPVRRDVRPSPPRPHRLALAARDAIYPDDRHAPAWLVFVPAARNPHKPTNPAATNAQRVEMLRLATADADRVAIWTDEIDRAHETAPSFWADTIERARTIAPGRRRSGS
jgi:nicotinic acid mononucleotide adenylyltransferase